MCLAALTATAKASLVAAISSVMLESLALTNSCLYPFPSTYDSALTNVFSLPPSRKSLIKASTK